MKISAMPVRIQRTARGSVVVSFSRRPFGGAVSLYSTSTATSTAPMILRSNASCGDNAISSPSRMLALPCLQRVDDQQHHEGEQQHHHGHGRGACVVVLLQLARSEEHTSELQSPDH